MTPALSIIRDDSIFCVFRFRICSLNGTSRYEFTTIFAHAPKVISSHFPL